MQDKVLPLRIKIYMPQLKRLTEWTKAFFELSNTGSQF